MWNLKNMVQTNLQNGLTEIDSKSMVSGEGGEGIIGGGIDWEFGIHICTL